MRTHAYRKVDEKMNFIAPYFINECATMKSSNLAATNIWNFEISVEQ